MSLPDPPPLGTSALPPGSFDGQVVIVTGSGTGLGKAIGVEFARRGARLGVLSRKEEHRKAGVEAVEKAGARAIEAACDIRDAEQVKAAFDAVEAAAGRPTTLVNNAAGNFPVPAEDMSPNAWRTVVDIVLNGTFNCSREFARRLIAAGSPGSIVNIGASYAWTGGPGFAHSAAAKAGVTNLMESLRIELRPHGVDVSVLLPGFVRTQPGPKKRKKSKPFQLELETATARMERAILARRSRDAFPWPLVLAVGLSRLLPAPLYDRLVSGAGRRLRPGKKTRT